MNRISDISQSSTVSLHHEEQSFRILDKYILLQDLRLSWNHPVFLSEIHPFLLHPLLHLCRFLDHSPKEGLFHHLSAY